MRQDGFWTWTFLYRGPYCRSWELSHLSLLFERFDGEAVGSDVHYSSQLEPVRWVGRPHRLPILHRTALRALENMTYVTVRGLTYNVFFIWRPSSHIKFARWNFDSIYMLETWWSLKKKYMGANCHKTKKHLSSKYSKQIFIIFLCKQAPQMTIKYPETLLLMS